MQSVDGTKIKKPISPFFIFKLQNMKSYGDESGIKSCFQQSKGLGEIWKNMTEVQKKKYYDLSREDSARYDREMEEAGLSTISENHKKYKKNKNQPKKTNGEGAPKRPRTSYFIYCDE